MGGLDKGGVLVRTDEHWAALEISHRLVTVGMHGERCLLLGIKTKPSLQDGSQPKVGRLSTGGKWDR